MDSVYYALCIGFAFGLYVGALLLGPVAILVLRFLFPLPRPLNKQSATTRNNWLSLKGSSERSE